MRKIGPAWAERHGSTWRKRRGVCPEGFFVPNAAASRMRALIDEHETELANASADRSAGIPDRRAATFGDVAWAWHEHGRLVAGWKPATVRDRRSTLRAHLIPAFGPRPIRELTRDEVRHWWRGLHDPRRSGGRLSDRNANKLLAELRAILNWAARGLPADPKRRRRNPQAPRADLRAAGLLQRRGGRGAGPRRSQPARRAPLSRRRLRGAAQGRARLAALAAHRLRPLADARR